MDTAGEAHSIAKIVGKQPFGLVTSAFHMRRAEMLFAREGLAVTPVAAAFRTWPGYRFGWVDYLPSEGTLKMTSAALRERIGMTYHDLLR